MRWVTVQQMKSINFEKMTHQSTLLCKRLRSLPVYGILQVNGKYAYTPVPQATMTNIQTLGQPWNPRLDFKNSAQD